MNACAADTPTKYWQEEVKLLDGRVIVVKQKLRYEGLTPRESWVTLKLPETGNQETTWNEKLEPRNLNVANGKLYIVGIPQTDIEFYWYHKPSPLISATCMTTTPGDRYRLMKFPKRYMA